VQLDGILAEGPHPPDARDPAGPAATKQDALRSANHDGWLDACPAGVSVSCLTSSPDAAKRATSKLMREFGLRMR